MKKSVLAVLVNYGEEQLAYLQTMIDALQSFEKYQVTIAVHTNVSLPSIKGIDIEHVVEKEAGIFSVTDLLFKLKLGRRWSGRMFDYNLLPMSCRKRIAEEVNNYDYFIFSENDHLWLEHHLDNFSTYESILPPDRITGLIQYEYNEKSRFYPAYHADYTWDINSVEVYGDKVFAHFTNVHQGCFLISKPQLERMLKTTEFTNFLSKDQYSIKCKTNTDIYQYCGMKKMICISEFDQNLIHHLPNIYINGELGRRKYDSEEKRMQTAITKLLEKAQLSAS